MVEKMLLALEDQTIIFVSHNFSGLLIDEYDATILMENGKIIDSGKHAELLQRNKSYQHIMEIKSGEKYRAFPTTEDVENANCRFVIRGKSALNFVAKIPRGKIKQTLVRVIRKHIRKNSELPPQPILLRGDSIVKLLESFESKINAKEAAYAGLPEKYRFLSENDWLACEMPFSEILKCFERSDKRTVNISGIINAAYGFQQPQLCCGV